MTIVVSEADDEIQHTVFVKGSYNLTRPTSIAHWQLRDLISAADNDIEFYCVHDVSVYKYNASTGQSSLVCKLEFCANSMTVRHDFLAAGGLHGELLVYDLANQTECFNSTVGTTVNNALHIARHSNGETRLFVCCNDSSVKVFKLPCMDRVTTIRCPCPINYAALSRDGVHLVVVGDCNPTLLYQATPTGYMLLTSFTEAGDVGMCCAWNQHGSLLADCHQDGTVAVWEMRSGACVTRQTLPSAARSLKFAAAPLDLLAVSEHEERVTLIDTRHWTKRQVLNVGPPEAGSQSPGAVEQGISGIAFSRSGQRLWVGLEDCCTAYDIDSVKRRTFSTATIL